MLILAVVLAAGHPSTAEVRSWTLKDGRTVQAELKRTLFDKLVLVNAEGVEVAIPKDEFNFTPGDLEYLKLEDPPNLRIEFKKSIERKNFEMIRGSEDRVPERRATFGAKVRLLDHHDYGNALTVEFFAIGGELYGNRYLLLDRQHFTFVPSKENKYTMDFRSPRLVRLTDTLDELKGADYTRLGENYQGFAITVRDKRGKLIGIKASRDWLEEYLEKLEALKPGNYFDETCTRTFPTRPKSYMNETQAGRP